MANIETVPNAVSVTAKLSNGEGQNKSSESLDIDPFEVADTYSEKAVFGTLMALNAVSFISPFRWPFALGGCVDNTASSVSRKNKGSPNTSDVIANQDDDVAQANAPSDNGFSDPVEPTGQNSHPSNQHNNSFPAHGTSHSSYVCNQEIEKPKYDGPAGTEGVGICKPERWECRHGVLTLLAEEVLPHEEVCNGQDDDCNGIADDGLEEKTYHRDSDGDGHGNASISRTACSKPRGYVENSDDCNDTDPLVNPAALEICNGVDDNCNGMIDELDPIHDYYQDADGDGFGNPQVPLESCLPPPGYVTNGQDCDDSNDAVHPQAPEVIDGVDNDCDGQTDGSQSTGHVGSRMIDISAFYASACGVWDDGILQCWGAGGPSVPFPSDRFTQVSVADRFTCGIKTDGFVKCWGDPLFPSLTSPPQDVTFKQIDATNGGVETTLGHTCGVTTENLIRCWGNDQFGQSSPPGGEFTQVSTGGDVSCGLRPNGNIECWGRQESWPEGLPLTSPDGIFKQVSTGDPDRCAIRSDDTLYCWDGYPLDRSDDTRLDRVPVEGSFIQVSVSTNYPYGCGIKTDQTLHCFGEGLALFLNTEPPPPGLYTKIDVGAYIACGIKTDGLPVCWGDNQQGQLNNVPQQHP